MMKIFPVPFAQDSECMAKASQASGLTATPTSTNDGSADEVAAARAAVDAERWLPLSTEAPLKCSRCFDDKCAEFYRTFMEPLRPGQAQRSALPNRAAADGTLGGGAEPTRMYAVGLNF
jgi:hypothetical protein